MLEEKQTTQTEESTAVEPVEEVEAQLPDKEGFSVRRQLLILYGVISVIAVLLIVAAYLYYPFVSKIEGDWQTIEGSTDTYQLNVSRSKSIFTIDSPESGTQMLFEMQFKARGVNRYQAENTEVSLLLFKDFFSEDQLQSYKAEKKLYKFQQETKENMTLKLTNEGKKKLFGDQPVDDLFYFTLENYGFGRKADLKLRNETFAYDALIFERDETK